jgi:mono/diheme cytochrome c family protein
MRINRLALLAGVCVALGGCALGPSQPLPDTGLARLSPEAERGRDFAYRRCNGCHNVGPDPVESDGPAFTKLARLYNTLSLRRRFAEVSQHGVDTMPPVSFTPSEAEDLIAYIDSLGKF